MIIDYWPPILQEIYEFRQIAEAEQPEIDVANDAVRRAADEFYISTMTERGIARWESILGLLPMPSQDLNTRRVRVATKLFDQIPYTYRTLLQRLRVIIPDIHVYIVPEEYLLFAEVPSGTQQERLAVNNMLVTMMPANMQLKNLNIYSHTVQVPYTGLGTGCINIVRHGGM